MILKLFGTMVTVLFMAPPFVSAQAAEFYPLELVRTGQKGYGKTVFQGTKVENFDVEVLGVLHNVGPKQNLILARISGDKVKETGIFAGMSGSPVYIEGKLLGAVAYAFQFATAPIAGITPIQEMVDIFKEQPVMPAPTRTTSRSLQRISEFRPLDFFPAQPSYDVGSSVLNGHGFEPAGKLAPIVTPLNLAGFNPQTVAYFSSELTRLGLVPVRGLGGEAKTAYADSPLEAGSTVSVQMVRGDMDVSASGTVTHISGKKIYAFGHPFLSIGYTDMPLNKAAVVTVIPSLMNSQKVSATTDFVGSIKQDRATGIMGVSGEQPKMIPVKLRLKTSRNELKEYKYEVITDQLLTPFLMTFTVHNSIVSSERAIGGQTLQVKCTIEVRGQPDVSFENSVSDLASSPVFAALAASSPVNFLLNSGFDDLEMEKIDIEITAIEQTREAVLEKVWQDKLEALPGEEINLTVFLRKTNGDMIVEKYPVVIPEDTPAGPLKIQVADGLSLVKADATTEDGEFVPENLHQLIKAINNLKKNDRLYIRLFREESGAIVAGEGLPSLPPSILALYNSKKTSGEVKSIDRVIYFEYELPATDHVVKGQQVVEVKVKS